MLCGWSCVVGRMTTKKTNYISRLSDKKAWREVSPGVGRGEGCSGGGLAQPA